MTLTTLPPALFEVDPNELVPGDNIRIDMGDLDSLAQSIKAAGVQDPIWVRPVKVDGEDRLQVVDGHRRHAAAILAKAKVVPVRIRDTSDNEATVAMLITSLQKQGLNPMEEAVGFTRLVEARQKPEALAKKVGRSKEYVLERLALLTLPEPAQQGVRDGKVTLANAKLLLEAVADGVRWEFDPGLPSAKHAEPVGLKILVDRALTARLYEHDIRTALRSEARARLIEKTQEVAAKGNRPLYVRVGNDPMKDAVLIGPVRTTSGIGNVDVDPEAHKKEPCCVLVLDTNNFDDKTRPVLGCDDPSRHSAKGASKLKTIDRSKEDPPAPTPLPAELAESPAEAQAAWRAEQDRAAEEAAERRRARDAELEAAKVERERRAGIRAARAKAVVHDASVKDQQAFADRVLLHLVLGWDPQKVADLLGVGAPTDVLTLFDKGGKGKAQALAACAVFAHDMGYVEQPDLDLDGPALVARHFRAIADKVAEPDPDDVDRDNAEAADLLLLEDTYDHNRSVLHAPMLLPDVDADHHFRCGICRVELHENEQLAADEGIHVWGVEADFSMPHLFAPDLDDREPGQPFYCAGCGQQADGDMHLGSAAYEASVRAVDDVVSLGELAVPEGDGFVPEPTWSDEDIASASAADREVIAPETLTDEERDELARLDEQADSALAEQDDALRAV